MKQYLVLLIALLFASSVPVQGQGLTFLKTKGQAIVNANEDTVYLEGMGLGGWMVMEGYMMQTAAFANPQWRLQEKIDSLVGRQVRDSFYNAWLDNHVTKRDIDSLKSWGFNSVRVPMHYNLFTLPIEEEPINGVNTWLTKGFDLVDSVVTWCKQNEMYVVLDMHAAPGGQGQDAGISDYNPAKFSLFEAPANQDKAAALWKQLAMRYADEPYVAGYDLLNEPNWPLPGGTLLRKVYQQMTDSIRSVDTTHILFIEGNWFANDFTGLTPPWDDKIVYSPHKYWSFNDPGSISFATSLRDQYNVPLYLGETGENSNTWFTEAITLYTDAKMGWAWWNMKKIEDIKGPLQILKNQGYQDLLDYWNGNGPQPSVADATAGLMGIAEQAKIENCFYQRDVPDAMFRQIYNMETIPFEETHLPGKVYAANFDLGQNGAAYKDNVVATYHLNTGNFTAWNTGWSYRNDGVDIESSQDTMNALGYTVGWLDANEWMMYTVEVDTAGTYDINVRLAADNSNGKFRLEGDGADLTTSIEVASTGGWQAWADVTVNDIVLEAGTNKIRFFMEEPGFNLSSFDFIRTGATTDLPTEFLMAVTADEQTVTLTLNKPLAAPIPATPADFDMVVNGSSVTILQAQLDASNPRIITFTVDASFVNSDVIEISYTGTQIQANDGTSLATFTLEEVENRIPVISAVPGRVEAEDFFFQQGISLETTSDVGGGQNVGFLDPGDYMDYYIQVGQAGTYTVEYRTASNGGEGSLELQLVNGNGNVSILDNANFQNTGGWQTWVTTSGSVNLPAGRQHIRVLITDAPFNLNWMEFSAPTSIDGQSLQGVRMYPNPSTGMVQLEGVVTRPQDLHIRVLNPMGQTLQQQRLSSVSNLQMELDLSAYPSGTYLIHLQMEDGSHYTQRIVKTGN
jgi:endoglucanase